MNQQGKKVSSRYAVLLYDEYDGGGGWRTERYATIPRWPVSRPSSINDPPNAAPSEQQALTNTHTHTHAGALMYAA